MMISDSLLRRLGNTKPETAVGQKVEIRTNILDFSLAA